MKSPYFLLLALCLFAFSSSAQRYATPFVERKSDAAQDITISSIEVLKGKTTVVLQFTNRSGKALDAVLRGAETYRAMYLEDAITKKKYKEKWVLFGDVQPRDDKHFFINAGASQTFTLHFEKLDDGVKDINLIEPIGSSGDWDFYGIKLMTPSELATWQDDRAKERKDAEEAASRAIAAEAKAKQDKRDKQALEEAAKREEVASAKKQKEAAALVSAKARAKSQVTKDLSFDGVYCASAGSYIRLRPEVTIYVGLAHFIGRKILKYTYMTVDEPSYVMLPANETRFVLTGEFAQHASDYYVSEVVNAYTAHSLFAYDNKGQMLKQNDGHAMYIPNIQDNLQWRVYNVRRKTVSSARAEIVLDGVLDPQKNYVLFNDQTGKYFFFKVQ